VQLSNKLIGMDLAPFSVMVENHCCRFLHWCSSYVWFTLQINIMFTQSTDNLSITQE